ncbi:FAD-binding protein [Dongia sedimenti]|uniref:FAD-binding oxidoreductase n=1 Tax=Dongia sedimenti TaxID=3064282 RepID=A0ABU0YT85_9PROT|nr:FAD-binding oxidoreductase [Rhodospirillaceae bacterium R-7]
MTAISGWGRYPAAETILSTPRSLDAARKAMAGAQGGIARGLGRAYGDAAIGAKQTFQISALDRVRAFDATTGLLTAEAGLSLAELIAVFLPLGFFPPVVPGTKQVTLGGAVAADVHGKNHHRDGGFGDHVESLLIATSGGELVRLSPAMDPELFLATIGGMGLTGTIVEVTLRLRRVETGWIRRQTLVARNITAALAALDAADTAQYSVAWIDTVANGADLGRSLIFQGEHASLADLDGPASRARFPVTGSRLFSVPCNLPAWTLNRWSVGAFNAAYFRSGASQARNARLMPAVSYFFPLDRIGAWNRVYGKRGLVQHQSVIPIETAPTALPEMLSLVARRGDASFLTVLKKLGPGRGLMSFPLPGYTLALDFAMKPGLLAFLDDLDRIVVAAGGRIYLAKDSRQSRATFEASYRALPRFRTAKNSLDPHGRIASRLSQRLGI